MQPKSWKKKSIEPFKPFKLINIKQSNDMANQPDKYKSSFQAPDGYFDSFEQNLFKKMNAPNDKKLKVSHRTSVMDWLAVAATISAVAVSGWFMYQKTNQKMQPEPVAQIIPNKDTVETALPIAKAPEQIEAELVDELYTEIMESENTTTTATAPIIAKSDAKIAAELEEAGLIVLDIEDGLFDQFEL